MFRLLKTGLNPLKFQARPLIFNNIYSFGGAPVDKSGIILRNDRSGYYCDPNDVARRLIKLIALHDSAQNIDQITLNSTWHQCGIDELSYVELMLEAENEFYIEIADDDLESFKTVQDAVEYISRSFFTA